MVPTRTASRDDKEFVTLQVFINLCLLYLEPNWPLFLKVNPPKQSLFQAKQGAPFGFPGKHTCHWNSLWIQLGVQVTWYSQSKFFRSGILDPWIIHDHPKTPCLFGLGLPGVTLWYYQKKAGWKMNPPFFNRKYIHRLNPGPKIPASYVLVKPEGFSTPEGFDMQPKICLLFIQGKKHQPKPPALGISMFFWDFQGIQYTYHWITIHPPVSKKTKQKHNWKPKHYATPFLFPTFPTGGDLCAVCFFVGFLFDRETPLLEMNNLRYLDHQLVDFVSIHFKSFQ